MQGVERDMAIWHACECACSIRSIKVWEPTSSATCQCMGSSNFNHEVLTYGAQQVLQTPVNSLATCSESRAWSWHEASLLRSSVP